MKSGIEYILSVIGYILGGIVSALVIFLFLFLYSVFIEDYIGYII